jgi:hypothetical protein
MRSVLIRVFVALVFIAIGMWLGISVIPEIVTNMLAGKP